MSSNLSVCDSYFGRIDITANDEGALLVFSGYVSL